MKLLNLLMGGLIISSLVACGNDDDESPSLTMDNEESAELIANSLTSEIIAISEDLGGTSYRSVEISNGRTNFTGIECGETIEESFNKSFRADSVSLDYDLTYVSTLSCVLNIPVLLESTVSASSQFESRRVSTLTASTGSSSVTIDTENLGNLLLNTSLSSTGQLTQKKRAQNNLTVSSELNISSLSINTAYIIALINEETTNTYLIDGGTGSYNATVSNNQGQEVTITATMIFNGDGTVDLIVNGEPFVLDLSIGRVD